MPDPWDEYFGNAAVQSPATPSAASTLGGDDPWDAYFSGQEPQQPAAQPAPPDDSVAVESGFLPAGGSPYPPRPASPWLQSAKDAGLWWSSPEEQRAETDRYNAAQTMPQMSADDRTPIQREARDFLYSNEGDSGKWSVRYGQMTPEQKKEFRDTVVRDAATSVGSRGDERTGALEYVGGVAEAALSPLAIWEKKGPERHPLRDIGQALAGGPDRTGVRPNIVAETLRRSVNETGESFRTLFEEMAGFGGADRAQTAKELRELAQIRREVDPLRTGTWWKDRLLGITSQIPNLVGAGAAQKATGLAGMFAYFFPQSAAKAYGQYRDDGLSPGAAGAAAVATGVLESAIEGFLSPLEGLSTMLGQRGLKQAIFNSAKEFVEEPVQDASRHVAERLAAWVSDNKDAQAKLPANALAAVKSLPNTAAEVLGMVFLPWAMGRGVDRMLSSKTAPVAPESTQTADQRLETGPTPTIQPAQSDAATIEPDKPLSAEGQKAVVLTPEGAAAYYADNPKLADRFIAAGRPRGRDWRNQTVSRTEWTGPELDQFVSLLKAAKDSRREVAGDKTVEIGPKTQVSSPSPDSSVEVGVSSSKRQGLDTEQSPQTKTVDKTVDKSVDSAKSTVLEVTNETQKEEGQGREGLLNEPNAPSEPPPAVMSEPGAGPQYPVFAMNAFSAKIRERLGLPPRNKPTGQSGEETMRKAEDEEAADPDLPGRLIAELTAKPRTVTVVEEAHLDRSEVKAQIREEDSFAALQDARKRGDSEGALKAEQDWLGARTKLKSLAELQEAVGTEWGRSGQFRKRGVNRDFTLEAMLRNKEYDKNFRQEEWTPVTPEEREQVKRDFDALEAARKKAEEEKAKSETENKLADAQATIDDLKKQLEKERANRPKSGSKRKADAQKAVRDAWADFTKAATGKLFANPLDPELILAAGKVIKAYAQYGLASFKEFIERARADFGERIDKSIEVFRQAWDEENPHPLVGVDVDNPKQLTLAAKEMILNLARENPKITREEAIDAVHEELKKVLPDIERDEVYAIVGGKGQYSIPNQEEAHKLYRDIRAQALSMAQIQDLEAGELPPVTGPQRDRATDEQRRLNKIKANLKKLIPPTEEQRGARLTSALEAKKRYYDNRIADLKREIATRQRTVKNKAESPTDADLEAKIAEAKRLEKERDDLLGKRVPTDAELDQRRIRSAEKLAEKYAERIANKDFEPKKRVERELGPDAKAAVAKYQKLKQQWHEAGERERWSKRGIGEKVFLTSLEALRLPMALMTAMDLSAVGRQGAIAGLGHPLLALRAAKAMFKAIPNHEAFLREMAAITGDPAWNKLAKRGKLEFTSDEPDVSGGKLSYTKMEEAYRTYLVNKIPGIALSNRAFSAYLNRLRMDLFKQLVSKLGISYSDAELEIIGNYVNVVTGRGNMFGFRNAAAALARGFFAPRWVASRIELAVGQPLMHQFGKGTWRVRRAIAAEYGRSLLGAGAVLSSASAMLWATMGAPTAATGNDDRDKDTWSFGLDPRSSDFLKLRIGTARIDIFGGMAQTATLFGRSGISLLHHAGLTEHKGVVAYDKQAGHYKERELSGRDFWRFLRDKFAPIPSFMVDRMIPGEDYEESKMSRDVRYAAGMDVTKKKPFIADFAEMLIPLSFGDVYESMTSRDIEYANLPDGAQPAANWTRRAAQMLLSIFGAGVKHYDQFRQGDYPARRAG